MSVTPETLNRINSLKQGIEAATGETYTDLTEGVQALKDGYGQGEAKEEQEKTVDITENGTVEILPDEGKVMSKVTANVAVNPTDVGKPYIDTSKVTNFSYFHYNGARTDIFDLLDTSNGTDFRYMFYSVTLQTVPQLDTSKGTKFNSMFAYCPAITTAPRIDTSEGTSFDSMFESCSALQTVPQLDISKGTSFSNMFKKCASLESVSLTTAKSNFAVTAFQSCAALKNITIGEGWTNSIYLHYSNELTVESLHGMIENLADLTGQTAKTFQVGETNIAKIDEEHITMLNNKNWNYS